MPMTSAILPSTTRSVVVPVQVTALPVAATGPIGLAHSPSWVPRGGPDSGDFVRLGDLIVDGDPIVGKGGAHHGRNAQCRRQQLRSKDLLPEANCRSLWNSSKYVRTRAVFSAVDMGPVLPWRE